MDANTILSFLNRVPTLAKRGDVWLGVVVAVVLKGVIVPKASFLTNVVHILYKLIRVFQRPIHSIPESDLDAINGQRRLYCLTSATEPKYPTIQETLQFDSKSGHTISIDLHKPLNMDGKRCPLVIFFHGGGFVFGKPEMYRHVTTAVASHCNVMVAGVTYRLAPEHKFPAGVSDCLEATRWLLQSADAIGFDASRVAVLGDSAGGNLCTIIAAELRDQISLSLPVYPCITFGNLNRSTVEHSEGIILPVSTKLWFDLMNLGAFNSYKTNDPLLNPISRGKISNPGTFPRTHVITAELDILRDEGQHYVKYLQENGVNVTHKMYERTPHAFFGSSIFPHGRKALFDICDIIKSHFAKIS